MIDKKTLPMMAQAALYYAGRGWPVVPLVPGTKVPMVKGGYKAGTTTENEIIDHWSRGNTPPGVGIVTGSPSGIFVVDIDPRNGGELENLCLPSEMPATVVTRTPSGGWHYYFQIPPGVFIPSSSSELAPGVDVISEGHYIVAPPTRIDKKDGNGVNQVLTYEFEADSKASEVDPLPVAPEWLLNKIAATKRAKNYEATALISHEAGRLEKAETKLRVSIHAGPPIPEGQRNDFLVRTAASLRKMGLGRAAILAQLHEVNTERCVPPESEEKLQHVADWADAEVIPEAELRHLTDLGNAEILQEMFGDRLRWCPMEKRWYIWDGTRWKQDDEAVPDRLAVECVREMYADLINVEDARDREIRRKWILQSESRRNRVAMLETVKAFLPIRPQDMDTDPWKLNTPTATIDLRVQPDGTIPSYPHNPKDLITRITHASFDPKAGCPRWEQFMLETFQSDTSLIFYVQQALGYSLVSGNLEQVMFFCKGPSGRNGKSTMLETVMWVLGDYASAANENILAVISAEKVRDDIANLYGLRLAVIPEGSGKKTNADVLKRLTGEDTMKARLLYENEFAFANTATLWCPTNRPPNMPENSPALWRRLKVIPFNNILPAERQDTRLKERLREEAAGILRWLVEGCVSWQQAGRLVDPPRVEAASKEYRDDQDVLLEFEDAWLVRDPHAETDNKMLRQRYKDWCATQDLQPVGVKTFASLMSDRGFNKRRSKAGIVWQGVRLKGEQDDLL